MSQTLRCTYCGESFRWRADDAESAICPHCDSPFDVTASHLHTSAAKDAAIPIVYSVGASTAAQEPEPRSALVGLALLPLAIPMIWLLGPIFSGKDAVFTYATPVALALCATGLCLGVVLSADWSYATRIKSIIAIILLGYGVGTFLFFLKPEWVESIRRNMGGAAVEWQIFTPEDGSFSAKIPGRPRLDRRDLITGWNMKAYRFTDRTNQFDTFIVGSGVIPQEIRKLGDEEFFEKASVGAAAAVTGTITNQIRSDRGRFPQRCYVITLADKSTKRNVMIIRAEEQAFVAAVEGLFLPPDAKDVSKFFQHFAPKPKQP